MKTRTILAGLIAMPLLAACNDNPVDARESLLAACNTQQGIGWLKRQYGDHYCDCWADQARDVLSQDNYSQLVGATRAELAAADKAEREKIVRELTHVYSVVANGAKSCAKAAKA